MLEAGVFEQPHLFAANVRVVDLIADHEGVKERTEELLGQPCNEIDPEEIWRSFSANSALYTYVPGAEEIHRDSGEAVVDLITKAQDTVHLYPVAARMCAHLFGEMPLSSTRGLFGAMESGHEAEGLAELTRDSVVALIRQWDSSGLEDSVWTPTTQNQGTVFSFIARLESLMPEHRHLETLLRTVIDESAYYLACMREKDVIAADYNTQKAFINGVEAAAKTLLIIKHAPIAAEQLCQWLDGHSFIEKGTGGRIYSKILAAKEEQDKIRATAIASAQAEPIEQLEDDDTQIYGPAVPIFPRLFDVELAPSVDRATPQHGKVVR